MHQEAKRFAREDFDILLVGHAGHEEVEGTSGEAPSHIQLVETAADVDAVSVRDPEKVVWLSQTTLSVDETMDTVRALRERFPTLQNPPSDDICYATQNRQVAVKAMAPHCDLVIVVGSRNSSNSVRLVEVALTAGAGAAHLVDYAREIDEAWLDGVRTVGVTSGASVPEVLVRGVLDHLAERGWGSVEEVTTAEESLVFSLPRELRPAALDDEPAQPQREHDAGGDGHRREAVHQRCGDDQQRVRAARAVAHQHDGRNGEREQQGRRHDRTEQVAAAHPGHREDAAAEVERAEHRADGADPLQVDEHPEGGEPERQPEGRERGNAEHGREHRALVDGPLAARPQGRRGSAGGAGGGRRHPFTVAGPPWRAESTARTQVRGRHRA